MMARAAPTSGASNSKYALKGVIEPPVLMQGHFLPPLGRERHGSDFGALGDRKSDRSFFIHGPLHGKRIRMEVVLL